MSVAARRAARAVVFDTFGVASDYRPADGGALSVRAIFGAPGEVERFASVGYSAPAHRARVLRSEVAAPKRGDTIAPLDEGHPYRHVTFRVAAPPTPDRLGLEWRLDLEEVTA